jgi:VWFA-related protein
MLMGQMSGAQQSQIVPDAPEAPAASTTSQPSLSTLSKSVVPGSGTGQDNTTPAAGANNPPPGTNLVQDDKPEPLAPHTPLPDDQKETPVFKATINIRSNVNYVEVPVTVEDKHKGLVPGLEWRDFRIFENGQAQHISVFMRDPQPLSVALVIDQSVAYQTMAKVNTAISAIPGAFAPYDEVAVFTYNSTLKQQTTFTGSQSARLTAVIEQSKTEGRDTMIGPGNGPMGQEVYINDTQWQNLPTISKGPSAAGIGNSQRKAVHPLNDAILMAAEALAKRPDDHRRVIYVISDGQESGSQAKYKQVVNYLQAHKIGVYGTLVGDSATWGLGFLDRVHLPLMMADNILPQYSAATGGQFDSEFSINGIERSFAAIAEEARTQYGIGYYSHESIYDGKFRAIEVQVTRPGLSVIAPQGYYPSAPVSTPVRPQPVPVQAAPATK